MGYCSLVHNNSPNMTQGLHFMIHTNWVFRQSICKYNMVHKLLLLCEIIHIYKVAVACSMQGNILVSKDHAAGYFKLYNLPWLRKRKAEKKVKPENAFIIYQSQHLWMNTQHIAIKWQRKMKWALYYQKI